MSDAVLLEAQRYKEVDAVRIKSREDFEEMEQIAISKFSQPLMQP